MQRPRSINPIPHARLGLTLFQPIYSGKVQALRIKRVALFGLGPQERYPKRFVFQTGPLLGAEHRRAMFAGAQTLSIHQRKFAGSCCTAVIPLTTTALRPTTGRGLFTLCRGDAAPAKRKGLL